MFRGSEADDMFQTLQADDLMIQLWRATREPRNFSFSNMDLEELQQESEDLQQEMTETQRERLQLLASHHKNRGELNREREKTNLMQMDLETATEKLFVADEKVLEQEELIEDLQQKFREYHHEVASLIDTVKQREAAVAENNTMRAAMESTSCKCLLPHYSECTRSCLILEVKQGQAWSVPEWETAWEHRVRLTEHVSDKTKLPILIFPEGTCINNTSVMMLKKGSFEIGGTIYPVAIKYDPQFGDAFWNSSKNSMVSYLLRMMTSWALKCNVWYLPPMTRQEGESAVQFANRVKSAIAKQGGLVELPWDGGLKRDRVKDSYREEQQKNYSKIIVGENHMLQTTTN